MIIEGMETRQTTCNAMAVVDGERRQVASATCSIRPGRAMIFSIDMYENVELSDEDRASIARLFDDFMAAQLGTADALGIPIMPKK